MADCPSLDDLKSSIYDLNAPIGKRTHAAFYLRSFYKEESIEVLGNVLNVKKDSSLLRHEVAYILGQLRNPEACSLLTTILEDEQDDILVRHECAEALGAIGHESSLPVLNKYLKDESSEVSETCRIAIDLITWRKSGETKPHSIHDSVDPAPAESGKQSVEELSRKLMDTNKSLFERYRAMFSLRDLNTNESAIALLEGFKDTSALFRHEVAYVLGQMSRFCTVEGLKLVLDNDKEHRMVRHEAAEALGAIGGCRVESILQEYKQDINDVIKESCLVALDNIEYWTN